MNQDPKPIPMRYDRCEELDVLVVGAGFAGLYQLDHLRKLRRRLALELLSGRPGRFERANVSVLQRGAMAGLELQ
jgi:hypothetical protein